MGRRYLSLTYNGIENFVSTSIASAITSGTDRLESPFIGRSGAGLMAQIRHDHRISVAQRFQHVERQNGQREAQPPNLPNLPNPTHGFFVRVIVSGSKLLILRCSVILHRIRRNRSSKLKTRSNLLFLLTGGQRRTRTTDTRVVKPFSAVMRASASTTCRACPP